MSYPDNESFDSSDFGLDDFESSSSDDLDFGDGDNNNFGDNDLDFGDSFNTDGFGESNEFSFEEDLSNISGNINEQHSSNNEKNKIIKTAIFSIGLGLVIILVAFLLKRLGNRPKTNNTLIDKVQQEQRVEVLNGSTIKTTNKDNWVQVKLDDTLEFEETVNGAFTVTDIKHYAMVTNDSNDKQLRSVLVGNISGLIGTYEIEVPYEIAQKLSIGTVFQVSYKITNYNGYRVINGIEY